MPPAKTLLVEGKDDLFVVANLCQHRGVPEFCIQDSDDGVDGLLRGLPVRLKACNEGDVLGVMLDADENLSNRWQAVRDRLLSYGYSEVPDHPDPAGTIIERPHGGLLPRFGVWLMPDNRENGILEDFLRFLVPDGSPLLEHADNSLNAIPGDQILFPVVRRPKALIHTWLAWQSEPGRPLGQAISNRFLDPDAPGADTLVAWLDRLFFGE